jgi:predicted small metal-binding protein
MVKSIECSDVGVACDFEARAENKAELMKKVQQHAQMAHGMKEIQPELLAKVKQAMRNMK